MCVCVCLFLCVCVYVCRCMCVCVHVYYDTNCFVTETRFYVYGITSVSVVVLDILVVGYEVHYVKCLAVDKHRSKIFFFMYCFKYIV